MYTFSRNWLSCFTCLLPSSTVIHTLYRNIYFCYRIDGTIELKLKENRDELHLNLKLSKNDLYSSQHVLTSKAIYYRIMLIEKEKKNGSQINN